MVLEACSSYLVSIAIRLLRAVNLTIKVSVYLMHRPSLPYSFFKNSCLCTRKHANYDRWIWLDQKMTGFGKDLSVYPTLPITDPTP